MECLDEETILGFCRGGLSAVVRDRAERHIAGCDECRQLVSVLARSSVVELVAAPSEEPTESAPPPGYPGDAADAEPEDREDRPPGPLLRPRLDLAMAPTTPVGDAGPSGPSASPVQPGQLLAGKFEVERVLGQGGMGIVVAARHTQLEQRVALKFLLPVACEVPGAVARFLREGKAAASITSEHVARVMDTGVLDGADVRGAPYLVMEYLEGADLGAVLQQRGRLRPDVAMEYVLQACEAIVEAHGLGIVHRDLKPANLFLARRADGSPLVKVLDFGISKIEGGSRSQLTSTSTLMGSPRYMSPEQMISAKDVDARTDVWALGVILYELVTGKPVWHADTMQGLCALIATTPAPALREALPTAPAALEDAIARCLVKSRDERLASVADLALALLPIAPASARTSIERILRVARREHEMTAARSAPARAVSAPPLGPRAAQEAADTTNAGRRAGGLPPVVWLVGVGVALLLVAGIAVNAGRASDTVSEGARVGAASETATSAPSPGTASAPPAPPASALPLAPSDASPGALPSASSAPRGSRSPTPGTVTQLPPSSGGRGHGTKADAQSPAPGASSRALSDRK